MLYTFSQQLLEEKKEALSKQRVRVNDGQRSGSDKTYLMGLKEGIEDYSQ